METLADRLSSPRSGRTISLRLDTDLLAEVDARCAEFGVKRHRLISEALRMALATLHESGNGDGGAEKPAQGSARSSKSAGTGTKKRPRRTAKQKSAEEEPPAEEAPAEEPPAEEEPPVEEVPADDLDLDDEITEDEVDDADIDDLLTADEGDDLLAADEDEEDDLLT